MATGSSNKLKALPNRKVLFLILGVFAILSGYVGIYLYFGNKNRQIERTLNKIQTESRDLTASSSAEIQKLVSKIQDLEEEMTSEDEKNSVPGSDDPKLTDSESALEGELKEAPTPSIEPTVDKQKELERQQACDKANELSKTPSDMVFDANCKDPFTTLPPTTAEALTYLNNLPKTYGQPGGCYTQASLYQAKLRGRDLEYQKYQVSCGGT